jgi:protein-S-isoprenylcysteine O-methyltransferase Ste14
MKELHSSDGMTHRKALAPNGSRLTYGVVAACLALAMLLVFAGFYSFNLLPFAAAIMALLIVAFAAGMLLHVRRTARARQPAASVIAHEGQASRGLERASEK